MVEVVIPFAAGCPHRERALHWVLAEYRDRLPGWSVKVAPASPRPWVKARAVMPAVERSCADIVVVADADCWTDGLQVAVDEVSRGAPWAIPHRLVHRLTEQGTENVYAGDDWRGQPLDERAYPGVQGGGFVVAPREVILSVPLDARFQGWGQEDTSWAIALWAMLGPAWRGDADLIHLWHPPQPRATRRMGSRDGWNLRRRYLVAKHDRRLMRQLLEESRGYLELDQPGVHDHAA